MKKQTKDVRKERKNFSKILMFQECNISIKKMDAMFVAVEIVEMRFPSSQVFVH